MPRAKKTTAKKETKVSSRSAKTSRKTSPSPTKETPTTSTSKPAQPKLSARERAQKTTAFLGRNLRKPKVFVPVVAVVLLILLFVFRSAFVVAFVNGQPIFRAQYQRQLEAQAGKQVMNSLVTQSLIEQEASRRHISVSQAEIDAQLKSIEDQLAAQGQTLDTALAAQGLSRDSFMEQLKLQTLVQKMLGDKIKVTDAEVNDYISKNQSSLPTGESQDQIKAQVKQQLQQQKMSQQAQALVQELQAKAHITYFVNL